MKKSIALVLVLVFMLGLVGCNTSNAREVTSPDEQTPSKTLNLNAVSSPQITEVVLKAEGKEVHITDSDSISGIVDSIKHIEFKQSNDVDINAPGAISVIVDLCTESETTTITFPCYLYEDEVYSASEDSIKSFSKYFEQ